MSHYDVLRVAPAADEATVRRAYVALARRHHPDMAGGDAARMRSVNEAWATLGDPGRRMRYDSDLAAAANPGTPDRPAASPSAGEAAGTADLEDDDPVRVTVRLPRWVSLLPVGLFVGALGTGFAGLLFVSGPLFALALMELLLSCLFFLAAPFIALFAARTSGGSQKSSQ